MRLVRRLLGVAAAIGFVIVVFVLGGLTETLTNPARQSQPPKQVEFKELVLDGKSMADQSAAVIVDGVYEALSEDAAKLYASDHSPLNFSDDVVRVVTDENTPRDVREFLSACRQRGDPGGCPVHITGRMTTCYKTNSNAPYPCLTVQTIAAR